MLGLSPRSATVVLMFAAACCTLPAQATTPDRGALSDYFANYCTRCHGESTQKGGVRLDDLDLVTLDAADADLVSRMLTQLQTELMPPRNKRQPSPAERRLAIRTLETSLLASEHGRAYRDKLLLPQFGNWVDHEALFDGSIDEPPATPVRLWRHSSYVFAAGRRVSRHVKGIQSPFIQTTPENGIRDFAATSRVDSSAIETATLNARAELDWMLARAREASAQPSGRRRTDPLEPFVQSEATLEDQVLIAAIESTFRRVVMRPPSAAEQTRYVEFLRRCLETTGDREGSLRTALTAIYLSPEALYRIEAGDGPVDAHGRRRLGPAEIASALAHTLFDASPYALPKGPAQRIREALEQDRLRDGNDVERLVRQMLDEETYRPVGGRQGHGQPRLMRFFHEFFGYHRAPEVFKDADRVEAWRLRHDPRRLVQDADNLIKVLLREDRNVLEELLTTNRALVFHDGDNAAVVAAHQRRLDDLANWDEARVATETERRKRGLLKKPKYRNDPEAAARRIAAIEREAEGLLDQKRAEYERVLAAGISMRPVKPREHAYVRAYGLEFRDWDWPAEQPFALPEDERAGILTHPAWLVAHSVNDGNDPIHRGIWVFEKLLAGRLADVPPEVDARVPEQPHATLYERMAVVRRGACWKCHRRINPLGEAFERFDDFGRFRDAVHFDAEGAEAFRPAPGTESKPTGAAGNFDEFQIPGLEGEFDSAVDMMRTIARTDRARQSFIRHLFRFLLGRNETLNDSRTLRAADRAYVESGGSFRALVASLLASDSFLYRR